jgi:hypothetical protein
MLEGQVGMVINFYGTSDEFKDRGINWLLQWSINKEKDKHGANFCDS